MSKSVDIAQITVIAPINIAVIKYWGKKEEKTMLPLNDSVSINVNALYAKTQIEISQPGDAVDCVYVNDTSLDLVNYPRYVKVFYELRYMVEQRKTRPKALKMDSDFNITVRSTTNFPTSAGLASSAAGFAAIAHGLGQIFDLSTDCVTTLARLGSGSAARSTLPGWVLWKADTGSCETLFSANHWPEMRVVIIVLSDHPKTVSSTKGMKMSVDTSELLKYRVSTCVPQHLSELRWAIEEKDFERFASVVMKDSNQLHAVCLDTFPPLFYLSPTSQTIISLVNAYNAASGGVTKVAYTFDAGPNACLFMLNDTISHFITHLCYRLSIDIGKVKNDFIRGDLDNCSVSQIVRDADPPLSRNVILTTADVVKYIVISSIGASPYVVT